MPMRILASLAAIRSLRHPGTVSSGAGDELYDVPPSRFVADRDEQVRAARAAGDRERATELSRLRRPTRSAWAVNLLARRNADALDELLALGDRLRNAHRGANFEELRELSEQRRHTIARLVRRAGELAAEADEPLGPAAVEEVDQTLQAAVADPDAAEQVRAGRLEKPLTYAGIGPALAAPTLRMVAPAPRPAAEPGSQRDGERAERDAATAAAIDEAQAEIDRIEREVAQAGADEKRAQIKLQAAEEEQAQLRKRLADALQRRDGAVAERDAARRRLAAAERELSRARRRLVELSR
jgi:hypothetical protein